jgi:hypothetical protein
MREGAVRRSNTALQGGICGARGGKGGGKPIKPGKPAK